MKNNKLYSVNKHNAKRWNRPLFMPADVDRTHQNIFDGYTSSYMGGLTENQTGFGTGTTKYGSSFFGDGNAPGAGAGKGIGDTEVKGAEVGSGSAKGAAASAAIGALHGTLSSPWGNEGDYWYSPHGLQDLGDPFYNAGRTKYGHKTHKASNTLRNISSALLGGSAGAGQAAGMGGGSGAGAVSGYMALAAIVPQAIADILDNGWGVAWNEKLMNDVAQNNQRANSLTSAVSKASSLDELSGLSNYLSPSYTITSDNVGEAGTFAGDKLDEKAAELNEAQDMSVGYLNRTFKNSALNLRKDQIGNYLRNYSAYGGPIETTEDMKDNIFDFGGPMNGYPPVYNDMPSINLGLAYDYLNTKKQNAQNKNQMTNMFMGSPSSMFAIGGDMQTNSADYSTGLTHINAGLSHEMNPNDGVQMGVDGEGVPNLVEEGETVYNDYVFSNRILADEATKQLFRLPKKKDITFADISKKLEKEIAERPNDPISEAGFKAQMQTLEEQQERQKQEMEAERAKAAFEALSPEEQAAIMQKAAQEKAIAQQQAVSQQEAAMEQPTPEEAAIMQQQMMQADGSQAMIGQEPQMAACGGKMNKYDDGGIVKGANGLIDYDKTNINLPEIVVTGNKKKIKKPEVVIDQTISKEGVEAMLALQNLQEIDRQQKQDELMEAIQEELEEKKLDRELLRRNRIHYYANGGLKEKIYKHLGIKTDSEFRNWVEKQGTSGHGLSYDVINNLLDKGDWDTLRKNELFVQSLAGNNAAMKDALSKGYDFGLYKPEGITNKGYQWQNFLTDEMTNAVSKQRGNSNDKYKIDPFYNKKDTRGVEATDDYKAFTDYILNNASDEERMNYFKWIDANTGRDNKYINNGKLVDNWKEMFEGARNDGKWGIQHYTPELAEISRGVEVGNYLINNDGTIERIYGDTADLTAAGNYTWASPESDYTYNYFKRPVATAIEDPEATKVNDPQNPARKVVPDLKNENLRYVGLLGPAVGLGMMAAGIGKPDYSGLDAAVQSADNVALADYKPIGDYLTYRPIDIWYEQNRLNANARATDRSIMNSGVNQGSKMAGLLASGYNDQIASGDLYRKALEYNDAQRERVAGFNRGTNQFNAEAYNRNSQFNASARNQASQNKSHIALQAASQKLDSDAGWYNSLYGNVAGLFKGIGDLGKENAQHNMIARMSANGLYGTATPDTPVFQDFLKWQEEQKKQTQKRSKGGKNHKKHDIIL